MKMKKSKYSPNRQLELNFNLSSSNKVASVNFGKVVSINFHADRKKREITQSILKNTKSF